MTSEVTEHPVEQGSNLTDHVRKNARMLTLEMYVTNTPIEDLGRGLVQTVTVERPRFEPSLVASPGAAFRLAESTVKGLVNSLLNRAPSGPIEYQALVFNEPFDRIKEVQEALHALWDQSASMSAVTSLGTYDNMVLEKVDTPRTEPGGAVFTIDLKQIRTVTTASVKAPKPLEKRGAPATAKGSQSTKPVEEKVKAASILANGLDAFSKATKSLVSP